LTDLSNKTVAVGGSSGLVGSRFCQLASENGCRIIRLVRSRELDGADAVFWDYRSGDLDPGRLEGVDAVVHLGGESIAAPRWTRAKMERIERSRVESTSFLAGKLCELGTPPPVFVCASATGYYGNHGDEVVDESTPAGDTFLAGVCRRWENACNPLRERGVRLVNLRIGMVLSAEGGGLPAMLPVFRLGLGGRLGDGRHWTGWIENDDLSRVITFCIGNQEIRGPVNAVSPNPVINREFTRTLAGIVKRPALIPAPAFLMKLVMGRMADELLLASCRSMPKKLLDAGFQFQYPELESALRAAIS
jgi:uncharacterized protein (TIGR01777 family)